jgi:hypothetical protein
MRVLVFGLVAMVMADGPVMAESCEALVNQAKSGLNASQLDDVVRQRLQDMLRTGLSGDPLQCLKVSNGSLSSPPPEGAICNETPSV